MNTRPENIIVNSCEYTPVYVIPNTGVTQGGSYFLASNAQDVQIQKPVSDNLKRFYENSGNIESGVLSSPKPRILKKQPSNVVGNNLKLASFLLPKSEPQVVPPSVQTSVNVVNNVIPTKAILTPVTKVLKPVTTVNNKMVETCVNDRTVNCISNTPTLPLMEVDRKIVRVGAIPTTSKFTFPKVPPKLLPKEPLPPSPPPPAPPLPATAVPVTTMSNTTSVQLIKLGQTYHSLNQLSDEQVRIVNKALKLFSSAAPDRPKQPAYDPDTNTKFIYKVVSANDLTVTGQTKLVPKKRADLKKSPIKKVDKKETKQALPGRKEILAEPQVTRSGRTVKLSRHIRRASPNRPKKKITANTVHCFQCYSQFSSLYRLQRHYENYPTHIPERVHSNLFHCLQAILKGNSKDYQAHMFVQQLDQLIQKLKSLLPCLLKKMKGVEGSPCCISDEIGRLFGMSPGRYNLNMDALTCVKDTEGHCIHNPVLKTIPIPHINIYSRVRPYDDDNPTETEDCARINSVDKWPTISKRIRKKKKKAAENPKAKRMRVASENEDGIELSVDDAVTLIDPQDENDPQKTVTPPKILVEAPKTMAEATKALDQALKNIISAPMVKIKQEQSIVKAKSLSPIRVKEDPGENKTLVHDLTESTSSNQSKSAPVKFYSTHFDIRSSPIKLPSALVKKFQIKPEQASSYEVQIISPFAHEYHNEINQEQNDVHVQNNVNQNTQENDQNDINVENMQEIDNDDNNSLSNDFSLDQMFPDNEIPKEVLNELNELSFQSNIFDSPLTKVLKEINHFDRSLDKQTLFDPYVNSESNIEPALSLKDKVDGYFEPAAIHVKTERPNGIRQSALSHVKERSKILFEVCMPEPNINVADQISLVPKTSLFDTPQKTNSIFEQNASTDSKHNGLSRPVKSNGIFESGIKHSKDDTLISLSMIDDKSNDMMVPLPSMVNSVPSVLEKPSSIIDSSLIDDKNMADLNHSDFNSNDGRLCPQGQSVLNFLESFGSDCLAYPETDIRNNEDFHLDLFSFTST